MQYITHHRARIKALCGEVNLPAMTPIEERNGMLYYDGKPLCAERSQNALDYFCRNDDGLGMQRGRITRSIMKALRGDPREKAVQDKWDKVWGDALCQKYKRPEHESHWLWNREFFNAPIDDLKQIASLVGAKGA